LYNRHREYEINVSAQILQAQGIGRCQVRIGALEQSGFRQTALQSCDHARLNINRDHAAAWSCLTSHFQREESHAWAGFEDGHSFPDIRLDDGGRVL